MQSNKEKGLSSRILRAILWPREMFNSSLVGRIVFGQFTLIGILIGAILLKVFLAEPDDVYTFGGIQRMQMWLHSASYLADQPTLLRSQLEGIDKFLRHDNESGDREDERITLTLHKRGELIYASPGRPGAMTPGPTGKIIQRSQAGGNWFVLTQVDNSTGLSLTLSRRKGMLHSLASWQGVKQLLFFLLCVLLLLLFPSWLAVRWGLRPVRELGEQLSRRNSSELQELRLARRYREIRPVEAAVNSWLSRMRASQRRELDFIANAAHELRTPLTAILINAEALSRMELSGSISGLLYNLLQSSQRANRVAEQMLTALRNDASADNTPLQFVNLHRLIEAQMADLSLQADAHGVHLNLHVDNAVWIKGNFYMLESMAANLIGNAIKYTSKRGQILVSLSQDDTNILFEVEDEGPGIPVESREIVFERFKRLSGDDSLGSGLGLAISKSAIVAHGGRIQLDSSPRLGGLRVKVWLPKETSMAP